jgi:hypothetical protein
MRRSQRTRLLVRGAMLRRLSALEHRTLALGFAVAALGGLIAVFAWVSTSGVSFGGRYPFTVLVPGSTPPLAKGAQVRIAGKIAGTVTSVQPGPDALRVNASLSGQYAPLGRGASVHIGVLLGTSLVYLVVNPGDYHHPLPKGTVITQDRVTLSSSLPQALETFDAATRAALARDIVVTGEGWIGRGLQTNTAIADQRVDYAEGTPLLRAAVPAPGVLARVIAASATVAQALRGVRPDDNAAGTTASASFWQTLAQGDRAAVATSRFGGAEQQVLQTVPLADQSIAAATNAARAFLSVANQINAEDPDFESLFASGSSLVDAARRFNRFAPEVLRRLLPILDLVREPALALPLIISSGAVLSQAIHAYSHEIDVFARQLLAVTSYTYGDKPAIRITGTLGCTGGRDPYPAPNQAPKDRRPC